MIPLNQNLTPLRRSPIRVFTNLANETPGCIRLTIGEPDFDTSSTNASKRALFEVMAPAV